MITYILKYNNVNGKPFQETLCTVYDDPDDEATLKEYDDDAKKRYRLKYQEWRRNRFQGSDFKLIRCLPIGFKDSPWHNITIAANEA